VGIDKFVVDILEGVSPLPNGLFWIIEELFKIFDPLGHDS
jgi:hypothetical protein